MAVRAAISNRGAQRLALGSGAVFSVAQAAGLLPIHDRDARRWIRDRGLVRHLAGREVVIWGDLLDAVRSGDDVQPVERPAPGKGLLRARLEPIR